MPSTTFTLAGTSTSLSSSSFASTITSFSPGVVVSTGVLYLNVTPSGYCSWSILLDTSGCLLDLSTGTYCVLLSTTTILAGISATISVPSLATTVTSLSPVEPVFGFSLYSNVVPSGNLLGSILSFGEIPSLFTGTYWG